MANYQQIVDDIRSFLGSVDQTRTPELGEWARAYAQVCREANDRLRRCGDYLRQGLRSEAIHLAEAQPNLLDMVAALDFVELPDWENLAASYELQRAPRLLLDVAAELNEAYAIDQPLQTLLQRHRLMALAGAPLDDRLAVMRELAVQDPATPFWDDDIRTFETARLKQLTAEATVAIKVRDFDTVSRLVDETKPEHWRVDVPDDLRTGLERARRAFTQERGVAKLRQLLPQIDMAYSAMSYPECSQLLRQWKKIVQEHGVRVPDDLLEQVQPVVDWIKEQTTHRELERQSQAACVELEEAMDRNAANEELEKLLRAAGSYGHPVPEALVRRVNSAMQAATLTRQRKTRRNALLVTAVVLLAASGTGLLIWRSIESRQADQWHRQIAGLLAGEQFEEAESSWGQMKAQTPRFAKRPELIDLHNQLTTAQANENDRLQRFNAAVEAANAAGFDNPDTAAIAVAGELAKDQEEKLQVYELRAKVELATSAASQKREKAFREGVGRFAEVVRHAETAVASEADVDAVARLEEASKLAADLLRANATVSSESRRSFDAVQARLSAAEKSMATRTIERQQLAQMVEVANDATRLANAIRSYQQHLPNTPRSEEMSDALAHAPAWAAVEAWDSLLRRWSYKFLPESIQAVENRLAEVNAYLKAHPNTPLLDQVNEYREYLSRASAVLGQKRAWDQALGGLLGNPFIAELKCIRAPDGTVYYVRGDGGYREDSVGASFEAIVSNNLDRPALTTIRGARNLKPVPSPQSVMAETLKEQLTRMSVPTWEAFGVELLETVRNQSDLDPILRVIFVEHILTLMQQHGWKPDMSVMVGRIRQLRADDVAWMNPKDDDANRVRRRASQVMTSLPSAAELKQELDTHRRHTFSEVEFRVVGKGVLLREGERWVVRTNATGSNGMTVWAARAGSSGSEAANMVAIGAYNDAEFTLNQTVARTIPQGSMLFLCADDN